MANEVVKKVLGSPFFISLVGGGICVILMWGWVLFQRSTLESIRDAHGGHLDDDQAESLQYYSSTPAFLPGFVLGGIIGFLGWFIARQVGTQGGGASSASITKNAADIAIEASAAISSATTPAAPTSAVSAVMDVVNNAIDSAKQIIAPTEPTIKTGVPDF